MGWAGLSWPFGLAWAGLGWLAILDEVSRRLEASIVLRAHARLSVGWSWVDASKRRLVAKLWLVV